MIDSNYSRVTNEKNSGFKNDYEEKLLSAHMHVLNAPDLGLLNMSNASRYPLRASKEKPVSSKETPKSLFQIPAP